MLNSDITMEEHRNDILSCAAVFASVLLLGGLWWICYVNPYSDALRKADQCSHGNRAAWGACYQEEVRKAGPVVRLIHGA